MQLHFTFYTSALTLIFQGTLLSLVQSSNVHASTNRRQAVESPSDCIDRCAWNVVVVIYVNEREITNGYPCCKQSLLDVRWGSN